MTFLKKLGCAAAIALAAGTAQADIVMNDWTFNPAGTGQANGHPINEYLDVNGNGFIQLFSNGDGSFKFAEHAVFNITQADSKGALFPIAYPTGNITATLEAYGTGVFGGEFKFTGGTIKMYQNPTYGVYGSTTGIYGADQGNLIGTFNILVGGGGEVDGKGNPVDNGRVSVLTQADVGSLASGYFYNSKNVDMSLLNNFAFAFTNANTVGRPDRTLVKEVACEYAKYTGPGCVPGNTPGTYANVAGDHFFVSNNGQFKFNDVPEPGSVALFGIALFGLGAMRRRVK